MEDKEFVIRITNNGKKDHVSYVNNGISALELLGLLQVIQMNLLDDINIESRE